MKARWMFWSVAFLALAYQNCGVPFSAQELKTQLSLALPADGPTPPPIVQLIPTPTPQPTPRPLAGIWTSNSRGLSAIPGAPGRSAFWIGGKLITLSGTSDVITEAGSANRHGFGGGVDVLGSIYDPVANSWRQVNPVGAPYVSSGSTGAAIAASSTHIFAFGGGPLSGSSSGGLFNPATNTWTATSLVGAPSPRGRANAVWTGSRFVVFGGSRYDAATLRYIYPTDGGLYDPVTNTWSPMNSAGVFESREEHAMVWTGSRVFLFGGWNANNVILNSGALYDPATNTWSTININGAPAPRWGAHAIWTGTKVVLYGGSAGNTYFAGGGLFDPASNTWQTMSETGAPAGRQYGSAVWAGNRMVVFGGVIFDFTNGSNYFGDGGVFDPASNTWQNMNLVNAPSGRYSPGAVWTGQKVLVFGGYSRSGYPYCYGALNDGAFYDVAANSWQRFATPEKPRSKHTAIWTGTKMILSGGISFSEGRQCLGDTDIYDPSNNSFKPTSAVNAPYPRYGHTAVWTGTQMLTFGGFSGLGQENYFNNGGVYIPSTDAWSNLGTTNAPAARTDHTAIWTGTRMIVYGGRTTTALGDGAVYDPLAASWQSLSQDQAPAPRFAHTAIWTGTKMVVFGGYDNNTFLNDGAVYDLATNTWTQMNLNGGPSPRAFHTATWDGNSMIVWGGRNAQGYLNDGAIYNPTNDTWSPISATGAPSSRAQHTATLANGEIVIFGGRAAAYHNDGAIYNISKDSWTTLANNGLDYGRYGHTSVWTGTEVLIFGGFAQYVTASNYYLNLSHGLFKLK